MKYFNHNSNLKNRKEDDRTSIITPELICMEQVGWGTRKFENFPQIQPVIGKYNGINCISLTQARMLRVNMIIQPLPSNKDTPDSTLLLCQFRAQKYIVAEKVPFCWRIITGDHLCHGCLNLSLQEAFDIQVCFVEGNSNILSDTVTWGWGRHGTRLAASSQMLF